MFWVLKRIVSLRRFFEYPQHMSGPFPAILGKGPWLELGKICGILGYFGNVLEV